MDNRIQKLAKNIVNYSCNIQKNERVYINALGFTAKPLVKALIREIYMVGAYPYYEITDEDLMKEMLTNCSKEQLDFYFERMSELIDGMDAYIRIGSINNVYNVKEISLEKLKIFKDSEKKVVDVRIKKKYVVLKYPNSGMAQKSKMSDEKFFDFYYDVCTLDYSKMGRAMDNLVNLMNKTDKVKLITSKTNLEFSIKDIPAVKCDAKVNIPDGEVFTAPIRNSVNGYITYNSISSYSGTTFSNIYFEFKDGKIVKASANNTEEINKILDIDEGARFIGEFAIGINPFITKPMDDILFDEKITGSIHFTPGAAYYLADNGNKSNIHWDIVLLLNKENGGGEIYFDDILIQKDGIFVLPELIPLNKENLV